MSDAPTPHREQTKKAARARAHALRDLAKKYPDDYRELYEAYALAAGVLPHGVRKRMLAEATQ